jgi:hypothetical protein
MVEEPREARFVDGAAPGDRTVDVHLAEPVSADPVVERAIRRAGVEGYQIVAAGPRGDVADSAQVEHGGVRAGRDAPKQRDMVGGGKRRPLPAGTHVAAPEIVDDVNSQYSRHELPVAELARGADLPRFGSPMQHCLPMEADRGHVGSRYPFIGEEPGYRRRLRARERLLGLRKNRRLGPFEVPGASRGHGLPPAASALRAG